VLVVEIYMIRLNRQNIQGVRYKFIHCSGFRGGL
jgi:hypothetical protein